MDLNMLSYLGVELGTVVLAFVILVIGLLVPRGQKHGLGYISAFGLAGLLAFSFVYQGVNKSILGNMYVVDDFSLFFKQLFLAAALLVTMSAFKYVRDMDPVNEGEFYAMIVFAALGMMIMVSAGDLITLYLALEMMTISFYVLVGYRRDDSLSLEAGIKYLLLGGLSSGILLYGLSLVYGLTGTTIIDELAKRLAEGGIQPALILGLVMLIAGFGFKVSLVPFHMWSPDVYQGAPTPVTAFLAVGSKAAAFAAIVRVFIGALRVDTNFHQTWAFLLAVLAALTMIIGNLVAIPQTNIKRMLAYSSIAQAGYIMTGIVASSGNGVKGVAFYTMLYVFATVGAFTVATVFANATGSEEIRDFAGLSQRSPLMAAVMTVCLLSMAGIPPLAGFMGKFYLFSAAVKEGYLWLVLIGLIMSMVSVYYYLSVTKVMYSVEARDATPIPVPAAAKFVLLVAMVVTIFLGIYPTPLSKLANLAAAAVFPQ